LCMLYVVEWQPPPEAAEEIVMFDEMNFLESASLFSTFITMSGRHARVSVY
jgi:hypothetical protein